jgi:hypothetical protein
MNVTDITTLEFPPRLAKWLEKATQHQAVRNQG